MATEYGSEFPEYIITGLLEDDTKIDAILDYSVTPADFTWAPDPTRSLAWITSLIVVIQGEGLVGFDQYGMIAGLTNGVVLSIEGPTGTIWQSGTYKNNADWRLAAQSMWDLKNGGLDHAVQFNLTMENFSNWPMPIEVGNWIQATFNDDLTGLDKHRIYLRGGYATE
jgi:hypothetical protein